VLVTIVVYRCGVCETIKVYAVGFEPRISRTVVRHVTTRPQRTADPKAYDGDSDDVTHDDDERTVFDMRDRSSLAVPYCYQRT